MYVRPVRPRPVLAEALSRLVDDAWSGTPAELHQALDAVALDGERAADRWPRSAAALAAMLTGETDELRERGLRLSRFPGELLVERLAPASTATAA